MSSNYIIAVGAVYLDTILTVPYFPSEDEKLRATSIVRRRGGNCPNTLEVLAQLIAASEQKHALAVEQGLSSLYLFSPVPRAASADYQFIKDSLRSTDHDQSVSMHLCLQREIDEAASSYIIKSSKTGSRTIVNWNGFSEMTFEEFKTFAMRSRQEQNDCPRLSHFHFEGRIPEVTSQCLRWLAEEMPCTVSVEIEKPGREGLEELERLAGMVFYSRGWAESKGFQEPEAFLRSRADAMQPDFTRYLFCTWGAAGAAMLRVIPRTGERRFFSASPSRQIEVVDSIGAGDTFIAGILYGYDQKTKPYEEQDHQKHLQFAVDLATTKVSQEGFQGLGKLVSQHY